MGCDIHFFVERYTNEPDTSNGPKDISEFRQERINNIIDGTDNIYRWISADNWTLEKYPNEPEYWSADEIYTGRNYWLFYLLADVRYGPDWCEPHEPRGVPADASYAYKKILERWEGDGHSHSYFTLKELLEMSSGPYSGDELWEKMQSPDFLESIEIMKKIDEDPNNVRCVFFFDN